MKNSTPNKANLNNSGNNSKPEKILPILPVKWIIYRDGDAIATPNLSFLVHIYYFPN